MAIIKITLTEEHIKIITNFRISQLGDESVVINTKDLLVNNSVVEGIALLLDKFDEHIEGSEVEVEGRRYPTELEDYFWDLYSYITDNLQYIEIILHQFVSTGIKPGTYRCVDNIMIWEFIS